MKFSDYIKTKSKKPLKIEEIDCPDCGKPATFYDYGIDNLGNEDHRVQCENPRCPSRY